jgi:hypothetical protein
MATTPQLTAAWRKAREISVALMLSGREHERPQLRGAIDHLLDNPSLLDERSPRGYRVYAHSLLTQMEHFSQHLFPEILPLVAELRRLITHGGAVAC